MKLSSEHKVLYKAIDEILWEDWDPIGMKHFEGPRDEYESYVPSIFSLKINGESIESIALRLYEIETKRMGLKNGFENCKQVAKKIFNLNS
ncbi:MAG TPA: hypothetical protein VK671_03445 [Mucilaginibacter sp.]|jgi:hypothetical protein|nr:hypothetical protein [Mucilaginibacter sp.]